MKKSVKKKHHTRMSKHTIKVLGFFKEKGQLSNKYILTLMKKFKPDITSIWVCATTCNLHKIKLIKRVGVGVYSRMLTVPKKYSHLFK